MANFIFDAAEVFNIYKQSYNIKLPLHQILDDDFCNWIELHEKAINYSKMLVLPSLISLAAALCGPKTNVSSGGFSTTLNQYLIAVCDPGGGKSHTYRYVFLVSF